MTVREAWYKYKGKISTLNVTFTQTHFIYLSYMGPVTIRGHVPLDKTHSSIIGNGADHCLPERQGCVQAQGHGPGPNVQ